MATVDSPCRRPGRARFRGAGAASLFYGLLLAGSVAAQTDKPRHQVTEVEVKAAYLVNFPRFVEWPEQPARGDTLAICILGKDPFGPALEEALAGQAAGRIRMKARRIARVEQVQECDVLFVGAPADSLWERVKDGARQAGVLTVSDWPGFVLRGGMVEFVLEARRVRFAVNLGAAEESGLRLSSELLKLAVTVRPGG